jgi:GNAT superfamily N-acetyltransferase
VAGWIHSEWPAETAACPESWGHGADAIAATLWRTTLRPTVAVAMTGVAALPVTLVATVGGALAGTVTLCTSDYPEPGVDTEYGPWLGALYVSVAHRGKGVARALLTAVLLLARRLGLPRLSLWFLKSESHLQTMYENIEMSVLCF